MGTPKTAFPSTAASIGGSDDATACAIAAPSSGPADLGRTRNVRPFPQRLRRRGDRGRDRHIPGPAGIHLLLSAVHVVHLELRRDLLFFPLGAGIADAGRGSGVVCYPNGFHCL